jgi:PPOX class probable F420-dependent enzyme
MTRLMPRVLGTFFLATVGVAPVAAAQVAQLTAVAQPTPPPMTPETMRTFLARSLVAHLATVRPNGTPQVYPMWFLYEDGVLYMSTRTQAAKLRHIRHNPHVAVEIDVMEAPLKNKVVTITGSAEILTSGVVETTTKIYHKYMGAEAAGNAAAQKNIHTPRVILKIVPKKIRTMDTTGH